ncbi:FAD/NAD(P)-binding domain-containing protein [Coprinellus micaceus]|uniref:FAD/NAD(P)-binding domain-containing protein n=1 Tax=Coprinellus micaceus TaxID=71717 RepID=A0A4Y7SG72_COPMI|nr:FAD/NAD(P)-binding domain-containing protein [Coprinellus micaceus]
MKIAVVGSGVSGLAATWLLNEYSEHEVHLYESDSRPGGHANTVRFEPPGKGDSEGVDVDTGFIVCNPSTYPNFLRFAALQKPGSQGANVPGVQLAPTEMTFSVSRNAGEFEWAGKNPLAVFCQPWRFFEPSMWRMVYDVFRFNACAIRVLMLSEGKEKESIGEYLENEGYSNAFKDDYLIPMTAAIWSTPPGKCFDDFPAKTLIQFMYNHHLLQIIDKPSWLTLQGGSHTYVKSILAKLPKSQLHLSTAIASLTSHISTGSSKPTVTLSTTDGKQAQYDHVILACHSDAALKILEVGNATKEERDVLGMFEWNRNEVVLHSDPGLMPQSRMAWSCWNYLTSSSKSDTGKGQEIDRVSLTYGMNDLQHISETKYGPVLVTLNPPFHPDPEKTRGWWKYDHPVLDAKAVEAQYLMPTIQNRRSITFAGAWLKYGFHEDGFTSGLLAACAVDEEPGAVPIFSPGPSKGAVTSRSGSSLTIETKNITVHPPFDIRYADHHLTLKRNGVSFVQYIAALGFDVLEVTGVRVLMGLVFGTIGLRLLKVVSRCVWWTWEVVGFALTIGEAVLRSLVPNLLE